MDNQSGSPQDILSQKIEQASQNRPSSPKRTLSGKRKIVFIIFLLFIVGGTSFYFYLNKIKVAAINDFESCKKAGYPILKSYPQQCRTPDKRTFVQQLSEEEKKKLKPPTPTPDPTANWKTYTDKKLGYSFKYPSDWTISKDNPYPEELTRQQFITQIPIVEFIVSARRDYDPRGLQQALGGSQTSSSVIVDNNKGTLYETSGTGLAGGMYRIDFVLVKDGISYIFLADTYLDNKEELKTIFGQILSTFKFLDAP